MNPVMISLGFVMAGTELLDHDGVKEILESLGVEQAGDVQMRILDPRFDVPSVVSTHHEELAFPTGYNYVSYTVPVYPKDTPRPGVVQEEVTALVEAGPGYVQPRKAVIGADQRQGLRFTERDLPKDNDI